MVHPYVSRHNYYLEELVFYQRLDSPMVNRKSCFIYAYVVNKTKISECVIVQHWCRISRQNKRKISVSLCLCLLLRRFLLLLPLCRRRGCWLARSSFANRQDRTAPQWSPLMFNIFFRSDICMRGALNYPYVLDTMVCYPPTLQNLAPLNPDEHTPPWSSAHNSVGLTWGRHLCVQNWHILCNGRVA